MRYVKPRYQAAPVQPYRLSWGDWLTGALIFASIIAVIFYGMSVAP